MTHTTCMYSICYAGVAALYFGVILALSRLDKLIRHFFSHFPWYSWAKLGLRWASEILSPKYFFHCYSHASAFHLPVPLSADFSYILVNLWFQVILESVLPSNRSPSPGDLLLSYWPGQMVLLERCQHPTKEPVHGQRGFGRFNDPCPCVLYPCSLEPHSHLKRKS